MTSLEAPEFWRFWLEEASKRPRKGQERPGRGQKRSGRGQEEARKRPGRGQEEARKSKKCSTKGTKRPGIQNLAKNCSKRNVL